MKIDKKTLLITDFEDIDQKKLLEEIRLTIIDGTMGDYFRKIGKEWMKLAKLDTNNLYLVCLSTVFPLRVFQSMIDNGDILQDN